MPDDTAQLPRNPSPWASTCVRGAGEEIGAAIADDDGVRVRPGQSIGGRYLAIRPLGEGGMGTLWEVEHRELERRFALKLLRDPRAISESNIARFKREAKTAAAIDHPNVVRVTDYHVDPVVGPFLVMELLLGRSLAEEISPQWPMELREAIEWIAPVAFALDALHERGLVHRDVKPENIVRTYDRPVVKLVDFGLAAHADGRDRVTRKGTLLGTPQYMAPEVAEGEPATPASDIYSLAVVGYELLTGRLPHDGDTPLAVVRAKLSTPHPSLEQACGRMFAVPIEMAFSQAFDLDPHHRQASASDFVHSLVLSLRR